MGGTRCEGFRNSRSNPLASLNFRDELEKLKTQYSRKLTILSAVNNSLAEALDSHDNDTAERVEFVDEHPTFTATSIMLHRKASSSSISTLLDGSLDPFIVCVTDLTPRQQSLLQFCT